MTKLGSPLEQPDNLLMTSLRERPPPFSFRRFMYNSKEGTFMSRTPASWGKLMLYKKKTISFLE